MEIMLTAEESTAVRRALDTYRSDLRMEIVDTDNPAFRRDLRAERELLDGVLAKLDEAAAASPHRDADGRVVVRMVGIWSVG